MLGLATGNQLQLHDEAVTLSAGARCPSAGRSGSMSSARDTVPQPAGSAIRRNR